MVQEHFRGMLSKIVFLNHEAANEISKFASFYHNLAAQEITSVITDFIRDVSPSQSFQSLNAESHRT